MAEPEPKIDDKNFDVAIFCALYEEAEAVKNVFESLGAKWETKHDRPVRLDYSRCSILNKDGDSLAIYLTWLPNFGPVNMAQYGERVLTSHKTVSLLQIGRASCRE